MDRESRKNETGTLVADIVHRTQSSSAPSSNKHNKRAIVISIEERSIEERCDRRSTCTSSVALIESVLQLHYE